MKIGLTSVFVHDPITAFKFYTEVLGFVERMYVPESWVAIVVSPEEPHGTGLLLEPNHNKIAKTYQKALYGAGIPAIVFGVADIYAEYDRLVKLDKDALRSARMEKIVGAIENNLEQIPELKDRLKALIKEWK